VADHPVKVPEDLVSQWWEQAVEAGSEYWPAYVADRAAQWGADQELEACCEYLQSEIGPLEAAHFRAAMRPKPPSLAEQGTAVVRQLKNLGNVVDLEGAETKQLLNVLEEALTRLAELEAQQ